MQPDAPLLSIVVPAFNEEATLREIVARLLAVTTADEIILVDDCSTDRTGALADQLAAEHPRIKVAHHPVNAGKTEALKTGFAMTTGQIVIVQDADLEYDPAEIADVIAPIIEGHADVVYGSRFLVRKASRVLYFYHYVGNKALTFLSNLCTNVNMTDVETCYKAFRGDIIRNMTITSRGFGFEIEVTAKVAKLGVAIYEVPISYHGRTYEQGKKIGIEDGFAALWYIFRFNFLCSLARSFRVLPEAGSAQRAARSKPGAPVPRSTWLALLAVLFFIASACVFIPKIGIEEDEVLFVPGIYNPRLTSAAKFGTHAWPLMVIDYVGADKLYLYKPILKLLPPTLWTLRIPMVLAGALSLWLLFVAVRRLTSGTLALALVWLIATDPIYLLTTTVDWGPVALQHLFVIAAFALLARPAPRVFWGFVMLGLAIWDKGTAIWILGAMALSALLVLPRPRVWLRARYAVPATAGFVLGALPFLAFNIRFGGATFLNNATFATTRVAVKLWAMLAMLTGRGMFGFLMGGTAPAWYLLAPVAMVLAAVLLFHPKAAGRRRIALFGLFTGVLTWLGMLFAATGGTSAHHIILVWPWPQLFAVCVLGSVLSRKPFVALVALMLLSNIVMTGLYAQRTFAFGPGPTFTDATLRLPEFLPASGRITAIDWGIANISTFLVRGKVPVDEITFTGFTEAAARDLDRTVFLSHVPGEEIIAGANARFDAAIDKLGYMRVVDHVIPDSRGRPVLVSFHCVRRSL